MPLAGCIPVDLSERAGEVLERDREEGVRVAYVAATRARDLLVVPATGDGELDGWLTPLNRAIYPPDESRRTPGAAPGCPPFGAETVLDRPGDTMAQASVSPGLHAPRRGPHQVVWWDPRALELNKEPEGGLRSNDLLVEHEGPEARAAAAAHAAWRDARQRTLADGAAPSLRVVTATALSIERAEGAASEHGGAPIARNPGVTGHEHPIELLRCEPRAPDRPGGKRFGALVHAVLERVALDADRAAVERTAANVGRATGSTAAEIRAASDAVVTALAHPLLRAAAHSADCRREVPIAHRLASGEVLEGVVDLAFRDASGWTVIDFKTDARAEDHPQYAAQVRLYCDAVAAATGEAARGVLLSV
jgi:hypothetical protein